MLPAEPSLRSCRQESKRRDIQAGTGEPRSALYIIPNASDRIAMQGDCITMHTVHSSLSENSLHLRSISSSSQPPTQCITHIHVPLTAQQ